MIDTNTRSVAPLVSLFRVLLVVNAVTFLLAALAHTGTRIPLGFVVLAEPRIVPATIVEGLSGLLFALSAYALFARKTWALKAAVAAHAFATAGVLLGMYAIAAGWGPRTGTNDIYHRVMLLLLAGGMALLSKPATKVALRY